MEEMEVRGPCVEWTHARDRDGYGVYGYPQKRAHRTAWENDRRMEAAPDLMVLHICDNPPCVNPQHLYLGTAKMNMEDRNSRGRNPNVNKTHCKNGHPFDPSNTYDRGNGWRDCKECKRQACRAYYQRSRGNA